jgi:hypothetical protein
MDIPSLVRGIRSAIADSEEIQKDEEHRISLLNAARALIHALEPPDVAITNVAIVPVSNMLLNPAGDILEELIKRIGMPFYVHEGRRRPRFI